jgi:hypothetical protein
MELTMSVLRWSKPAALAATIVVAGSLLAPAPVQAQTVTVLRGSPPQSSSSIDCSNPYNYEYCRTSDASSNQYYSPYGYGASSSIDCSNPYNYQYCQTSDASSNQYYSPYGYGDDFPYYGYGFPVGLGFGRDFFHHGRFHGGFHRGGFHNGFVHRGGFRGGGFHGGFHGGGFSGGGFHGGGGHR